MKNKTKRIIAKTWLTLVGLIVSAILIYYMGFWIILYVIAATLALVMTVWATDVAIDPSSRYGDND